ncbi:MAG: hypothetical protein MUO76_05535 [Anaerolineaceae bacterium]|nr:hypothetical protein [Anaerolineaceae bacterium]
MMSTKPHTKLKKFLPFILIILALGARTIPGARTIDDSYITFRYARNLLSGEGFVYNPGERVLGTTTPLFTLLMVGLGSVSGGVEAPFPWLALGLNALADAVTCLMLWQLGRRLKAEWAGVAAGIIWAVAPYSVTFAIGGLETSVYVLLLTGTTLAYINHKQKWTAFCAALALLTRPDALILLGPLALDWFVRSIRSKERVTPGAIIIFLLPTLSWGIFATLYFGSPIPHSVQAKIAAYYLPPTAGFIRLLQHYATPLHQHNYLGSIGIGIGLVLFPFLFLVGARRAWQAETRILSWLLYPWLYFAVFSISNPLIFRWYLTPPLPAYFLFILLGADQLLGRAFCSGFAGKAAPWRQWIPAVLLCMLPLISILTAWELHPDHGPNRAAPQMAWFKLEQLYQQVAEMISPELDSDTVLAAGDVGALGYFTGVQILDTVGLNSPQTLQYYPLDKRYYVSNYAIPTKLILDEKPDWLVILEIYGRLTLLQDERFNEEYTLWRKLPSDIYDSDGMLIFRQTDI